MNNQTPSTPIERYLTVDLHKYYVVVGGVYAQQQVVLPARRMDLSAWPTWAKKNLRLTDALVIEATTNAWDFYDQVKPLVSPHRATGALQPIIFSSHFKEVSYEKIFPDFFDFGFHLGFRGIGLGR